MINNRFKKVNVPKKFAIIDLWTAVVLWSLNEMYSDGYWSKRYLICKDNPSIFPCFWFWLSRRFTFGIVFTRTSHSAKVVVWGNVRELDNCKQKGCAQFSFSALRNDNWRLAGWWVLKVTGVGCSISMHDLVRLAVHPRRNKAIKLASVIDLLSKCLQWRDYYQLTMLRSLRSAMLLQPSAQMLQAIKSCECFPQWYKWRKEFTHILVDHFVF